IRAGGTRIAGAVVDRWRDRPDRPEAWFTYHLYHKAPDWLGPPVADALGMKTVLLHPYAGVLSAYGMGLADIRALREKSVE
ncbi:hydantoinase/oxoprolinase family protein, partial [Klebsiella pneumoniae]